MMDSNGGGPGVLGLGYHASAASDGIYDGSAQSSWLNQQRI